MTPSSLLRSALPFLAFSLLHDLTQAQFTYVAQERTISLQASGNDASGVPVTDVFQVNAPDFLPFAQSPSLSVTEALGTGFSTADVTSELAADRMTFTAFTSASATAPSLVTGAGGSGISTAELSATFVLATATPCVLTGNIDYVGTSSTPFLVLEGPTGILWSEEGDLDSNIPVRFQDTLDAGTYTLRASAFASQSASEFFSVGGGSTVSFLFEPNPGPGTNYCTSVPNSAGTTATIRAEGSAILADQDLILIAEGLVPQAFGLFFFGPQQANQPLGAGTLCVGGPVTRLHAPAPADAAGTFQHLVTVAPGAPAAQFTPGSTWNFQLWYRDPAVPQGSNTTDARAITFR